MKIYTFIKQSYGKYKPIICGKSAAKFYMTHGFPVELFVEEINNYPAKKKLARMVIDWKTYVKEKKISDRELDYIREQNSFQMDKCINTMIKLEIVTQ